MLCVFLNASSEGWFPAIVDGLVAIDQWAFIYINRVLTATTLDGIAPVWREAQTWYPFYLFLLVFTLINFGQKAWWWMVFFGVTIAFCDQISSSFIKEFFARPRPCSDPQLASVARLLLNRCPGSGSFTSSHAANHFGMAVFIAHTFKDFLGKWKYAVYAWAASICYAQVYVGVHYPFDVIGGAIVGALIGSSAAAFYNKRYSLTLPTKQTVEI